MRTALQFLLTVAIACSLTTSFLPAAPMLASESSETSCCAMMKMRELADGCAHQQAPKSGDNRCCSVCPFCVAVLSDSARPFVYAPSGDQRFLPFSVREHVRSHKPPVPPPRLFAV